MGDHASPYELPAGSKAWMELLHAEVSFTLAESGIRYLIVKGPSISEWLYPHELRVSSDADVLVPPDQFDAARQELENAGFSDYLDGLRAIERPTHATTLSRVGSAAGEHQVDLHNSFPGIELDPQSAFDLLWARRQQASQAGIPVWFPDQTSRALIVVLHAARGALTAKVSEDLRRLWAALDDSNRHDVVALATELDALGATRAGLETISETRASISELGLDDVHVPTEWLLLSGKAPGAAVHFDEISAQPWRRRPAIALRWVFPSPALMRIRDPRATKSQVGLAIAYASRLGRGVRQTPSAIRTLREMRRRNG